MTNTDKHLGFVGIGRMGAPMAERLIQAGYTLTVYDPNKTATDALAAKGAQVADSPKAVADAAPTVLISLPMPQVVVAVGLGDNGLSSGSAVRTVIDLSTTGPEAAAELAAGLAEKSITTIDCPVSGGVAGATKGTLALMVSGDAKVYESLQPVLAVLGRAFYVGERPGQAQTMKVINNLISVTALSITSEAMVMGAKAGLDPDRMLEVINAGSGRTNASEDKIPKYVLTRSFGFGFAIGLSAKDVRLCLEESERLGVPLHVGNATRELLNAARDKFGDQADMTEIIRYVEDQAGVEVRGKAAVK
ncbi:NAD(P)-dependent oxidoreductase [Bordetella genomosp. 13]|uniref:Oxidoreductase n=1 Tax=Bordetella genomosp. 13 TaxID=463040 RepID=A0A1W6ZCV2_9BORD|nr:NAD(P)-dependent oxidoreductase [Bordetella genomosp. 13]ARP95159.1 oxidoreductase [Bordetella genomosp. 13]